MNPDDLAKILDELGQRLGPTGSHVFELAVRQQVILGVIGLVAGVTLVALGIIVGFWEWRKQPPIIFGPVIAGVSILPFLVALPLLLNPEYAAIRDLLGALR